MSKLAWTKKRSIITIAIIAILATSLLAFWQTNNQAQAAIINPHPGLVGWWRFDEGTGTNVGDSSGNGNNGTINGAAWTTGKYGQALSFDGIANYVSLPDSSVLNFGTSTNFTISCWLNAGKSGVFQYFLVKDYGGPGYWQFEITSSNVLAFVSSDGSPTIVGTVNVADGKWHFVSIVAVRNGKAQLYVDGVADGSTQTMAGGTISSNAPLRLGSTNLAAGYFKGTIDEVSIYDRALSPTEIQTSFQQNPDFSSNLQTKVPMGATQVITTISWQGTSSINVTIVSPSQNYTEAAVPVYQKTIYSTSGGLPSMLNIKRLSVSINALASDQNWYIVLAYDTASIYQIAVEIQK